MARWRHLITDSCSATGSASSGHYWLSTPSGWWQDGWSGSCNLTSWCVLPDHRSRSISLLTALLRQDGCHFTVLTPDVGPQEPDKRNPLAVAAAAAWLGVGFVTVVAVAWWARGGASLGRTLGRAAVCSPAAVSGVCILQALSKTASLVKSLLSGQ
jgi:hypothetical protein